MKFIYLYLLYWSLTYPLLTPILWATSVLDSMDAGQIISQNQLFQDWAQTNINQPYTAHAIRLAKHLSWGNMQHILKMNGISLITLNAGCGHKCQGCISGCDLVHQKRQMSWENFQEMVYRLTGFQQAMDSIFGKDKIVILNRNSIAPYFDSDPMMTLLPDRNGNYHNIADAMFFFKEHTGRMMYIWTSGWPAKHTKFQAAAKSLVQEQLDKKNNFNSFLLELKPFTLPFIENIKKIMPLILLNEPSFVNQFTNDFNQWGMELDNYTDPPAAWSIYNQVVFSHWEEILEQSNYFQERLANIKTILPLLQKYSYSTKVAIYSLGAEHLNLGHQIPRIILPFLTPWRMRSFLKKHFGSHFPDAAIEELKWNFSQRTFSAKITNFDNIRVGVGGDINFINCSTMFSTDQTAALPFTKSLTHKSVFFSSPRKPWQEVAARLTSVNHRYLSLAEIESIQTEIHLSGILEKDNISYEMSNIKVVTHVDFDLVLDDQSLASVKFVVTDKKNNQHKYRFVFPGGHIVKFETPVSITLNLSDKMKLFVANPQNQTSGTRKLFFAFQNFPKNSYQRALALFGFLQEQKYATSAIDNSRVQLTAPKKSIYKTLLPLLASGLPLLEQQTIELLTESLPKNKVIDELSILVHIYAEQLSSSINLAVLKFINHRIALYLQNEWINDIELDQLINLFRVNLGVRGHHHALKDLAVKILNHTLVSKLVLDRFFDLIENLELSLYPNLLSIMSEVTNPVIQVPLLKKIASSEVESIDYSYIIPLEKYLINQQEFSAEAQEILLSFVTNQSLDKAEIAMGILPNHQIIIPRLMDKIISSELMRTSNFKLQVSAIVVAASSANVKHLQLLEKELRHVSLLNYFPHKKLIKTLEANPLCQNTEVGGAILARLRKRFGVVKEYQGSCRDQAGMVIEINGDINYKVY